MTVPADPGWAPTNDSCDAIYTPALDMPSLATMVGDNTGTRAAIIALVRELIEEFPVGECELDPEHTARGEPHQLTLTWFEPVADPDCQACADTGVAQGALAGEPCPEHCAAWARLHPTEAAVDATHPPDGFDPPAAPTAGQAMPLGRWGDD